MLVDLQLRADASASALPHGSPSRGEEALFYAVVFSLCAWVLSLPVFPSQDGPMHLYYSQVIHQLLSGNPLFTSYYHLVLPPPPYSLHYVLLGALQNFFSASMTDKLSVCCTLVVSSFGFRFSARSFGPGYHVASLWAAPLFLSWPLFMGFQNYCLSVGLSLWAIGFWTRAVRTPKANVAVGFGLVAMMTALTHPVGLLFLGLFCGIHTLVLLHERSRGWRLRFPSLREPQVRTCAGMLACIAVCFGYNRLFMEPRPTLVHVGPHVSFAEHLSSFYKLYILCAERNGTELLVHRCWFALTVLISLSLALWASQKMKRSVHGQAGRAALICGIVLGLAIPVIPEDMNGFAYLAARLPILVFAMFLFAASATTIPNKQIQRLTIGAALVGCVLTLCCLDRTARPVAVRFAIEDRLPELHAGRILVFAGQETAASQDQLNINTALPWHIARLAARSKTLIVNDPFADSPNLLPVRHRHNLLADAMSPSDRATLSVLYSDLQKSATLREKLLSQVDAVIFGGHLKEADPVLALDANRRWSCTDQEVLSICRSTPVSGLGAELTQLHADPSHELDRSRR